MTYFSQWKFLMLLFQNLTQSLHDHESIMQAKLLKGLQHLWVITLI